MHGFFSAVSGGAAHEVWLEKVSNNLANANTVGYKGDHPTFESLFVSAGGKSDGGGMTTPVALVAVEEGIDLRQGAIRLTGNRLDLAIQGDGFFVVDTPQGTRYTRSGNFTVNGDGLLSTQDGLPVMGEGGALAISGNSPAVMEDGAVIVEGEEVGRLKLVDVDEKRYLFKEGSNLFGLSEEGQEVPATGRVIQGSIEASNVNAVAEMTMLINISRAYEAYQKVIHAMDETSSRAVNEVGKVG